MHFSQNQGAKLLSLVLLWTSHCMFISEDSYQDITAKLQTTQTNKQNKDIKLEWIVLKNKTWTLIFFKLILVLMNFFVMLRHLIQLSSFDYQVKDSYQALILIGEVILFKVQNYCTISNLGWFDYEFNGLYSKLKCG